MTRRHNVQVAVCDDRLEVTSPGGLFRELRSGSHR
ncbi:MAG: hypothetical protein II553_00170 [Lachnospiraceae bacterium]|nr:hypothetical protein [Lachnospiraceae bacterium]